MASDGLLAHKPTTIGISQQRHIGAPGWYYRDLNAAAQVVEVGLHVAAPICPAIPGAPSLAVAQVESLPTWPSHRVKVMIQLKDN